MKVSVHSIRSTLYEGEAEKLICKTPQGQITVLDHHIPLISLVGGPEVEVVAPNGERTAIPVQAGFLEVRPDSEIVLLAETI